MSRFKGRKIVAKCTIIVINTNNWLNKWNLFLVICKIVENRVEQGEIEMENLKRMVESEIDQTRNYIEEVRQELNNVLKRKAEDRELDNLARIVETKAAAD